MKELKRPIIKKHFKEGTTIEEVAKIYAISPELFKYAQALDKYIDQLESEQIFQHLKNENN